MANLALGWALKGKYSSDSQIHTHTHTHLQGGKFANLVVQPRIYIYVCKIEKLLPLSYWSQYIVPEASQGM